MRIALFGGTFDPPHRGHIAIARAAAERFQLDSVLFAPVGRQPLKLRQGPTPYADRVAMVTLACADSGDGHFIVSDVDAPRPDGLPNYTVDTLTQMAVTFPGATLFNLIGADSFRHLAHWKEPERLLSLAEWIVISRPGFPLQPPEDLILPAKACIHLLDAVHDDVSATVLRARLRAGQPCSELISASVEQYIQRHGLYRNDPPATATSGRPPR